ncbi:PD-(D/E)XK nuclease family transposase, partial [uncultured Bacteroides sp.]|uniref:PD-(D/E)XK nuclease family transposase n=2 Tax=uncultured Bacteroides sp. TaxID=162156 RepID=UPI0026704F06
CDTDFERWIYVLKNMETLNRMPFTARKSVFEKLEKIVDIASLSKEERIKYNESIKVYRDNLVTMEFAEQKGRAEGLVEGIERGLAQGLEKGRAEGKIEERRTIALQMKRMGMPVSSISEVTGLSQSEIDGL